MQRPAVLDMMRPFAAYGGLWQQAESRVLGCFEVFRLPENVFWIF
jgi:hypothetical protein